MKAIVVYESLWGNTAAVARAVAEGIGPGTRALSTSEATADAVAGANLIVAGSPVIGFSVPSEKMIENIRANPGSVSSPPDLSQLPMRTWLESLPQGEGCSAAFETGIWWSPGGATRAILRELERVGYRPLAKGKRFIVKGRCGPLRDGELESARQWGKELVAAFNKATTTPVS